MNILKKTLVSLLLAVLPTLAFAQGTLLKQTLEIAEVELDDGDVTLSVFDMPEEEQHQYYLCVGTLGIGDDFVQFQFDPLFQLFIPLGGTLEEAVTQLETFKSVAKLPAGTEMETVGTLALANPSTGESEPVYITSQRFLFRHLLEFSIKRDGYVRATHISNGDFGSLLSGVKFYRKIHPDEE